ncbi:EamA family transporter [Anaerovibrio lipolyticus]|uniref:EamA family transporter n=1 Tax=Anaerovibrio lipolyticus TaxID=82374 RepID=UPI000482D034|nr:EamA family transporter [Anaerovibrio lipolyticus]
MSSYVGIAVFSGILSAFSQVLLKKSSNVERDSRIKEYLNLLVIIGYGLSFICMILMIIAFKGMPLKYGAVIESLVYLYIMILGRIFLEEKITLKRLVGNIIIIAGVIIFSMA